MKKHFLIPLLTVLCTVMAWADPTSITTLEGFESAIATEGDYVLNADIDASSTEAQVSAAVTINRISR